MAAPIAMAQGPPRAVMNASSPNLTKDNAPARLFIEVIKLKTPTRTSAKPANLLIAKRTPAKVPKTVTNVENPS